MTHECFNLHSLADLADKVAELGLDLPVCAQTELLNSSVLVGQHHIANRFALQPMEGCDGTQDGRPDDLTFRRYERFYHGGAGLVWFEATAVASEGRANPRQLYLNDTSWPVFLMLRERALQAGQQSNGADYLPYTVLQLTHSGRYSRPVDKPAPIIAHHDGVLDGVFHLPPDYPLITDQELQALIPQYVAAARLAERCGFEAVDIKSCHRYLINELLAAHTRPGGYGGSFENRTRLLLEIVNAVRAACPDLAVWVRLSCYDSHPFPWGWGTDSSDEHAPDMHEPLQLVGLLQQAGVAGINVTAGNPYFTPHINRPYDRAVVNGELPDEHPLIGVARLLNLARLVKEAYPSLLVIGSGFSWLRHLLPYVAAGVIQQGWMDLAGIGRGAFAYPDLVRDVLLTGKMNPKRACITCSRCTQIMRDHGCAGCAIFDREVYGSIYAAGRAQHPAQSG